MSHCDIHHDRTKSLWSMVCLVGQFCLHQTCNSSEPVKAKKFLLKYGTDLNIEVFESSLLSTASIYPQFSWIQFLDIFILYAVCPFMCMCVFYTHTHKCVYNHYLYTNLLNIMLYLLYNKERYKNYVVEEK